MDLSMDTPRLKDPLVLFGSESSALSLPLFLLSLRIRMLSVFFNSDKGPFLIIAYDNK